MEMDFGGESTSQNIRTLKDVHNHGVNSALPLEPSEFEVNAIALQTRIEKEEAQNRDGIWVYKSRGNGRGWSNYSSLEKTLWLILAGVGLIVIGLTVAVVILGTEVAKDDIPSVTRPTTTTMFPPWITTPVPTTLPTTTQATTTKPPGWNQCLENECVLVAARISSAIDKSINPCNDFYQYACGNWIQGNPVPVTKGQWSQVNVMQEQLDLQIKDILTLKIAENETEKYPAPFLLARTFYDSCEKQVNISNPTEGLEKLAILANGLADELEDNLTRLGNTLGNIRREVGGNYLFTLYVDLDEDNTTRNIIYLDQPQFGLPREILLDTKGDTLYKDAYRNLIAKMWAAVFNQTSEQSFPIAADIVLVEIALANITTSEDSRRNRTEMYFPVPIDYLQELTRASNFSWEIYFENIFTDLNSTVNVEESDYGIILNPLDFENMKYIIRDNTFFENFDSIIQTFGVNNIRNYLKWRILFDYGSDANEALRKFLFEFDQLTQGVVLPSQLWKFCVKQTNKEFGMAVSYQYVNKYFNDLVLEKANKVLGYVRSAFLGIVAELDWIDDKTKERIVNKTEKINTFLGYPSWLQNHTLLADYYLGLKLASPSKHFSNFIEVSKWHNLNALAQIYKPKNSAMWPIDPTIINSLYSPNYNSLSFPAALLQNPLFRMPLESLNYGAFGAIIGHEITQGFTDTGIQSDGDGNLGSWWNDTTLATFHKKVDCFIHQYEKYTVNIGHEIFQLNGETTLGENIADNGGIRQAFRAYKNFVTREGEEKLLPGMTEFTSNKLFFLSYAQTLCGSYTPTTLRQLLLTGAETPNRFRIKGAIENSIEFANTWGCKIPETNKTCRIW